jgi:hypothetical protein
LRALNRSSEMLSQPSEQHHIQQNVAAMTLPFGTAMQLPQQRCLALLSVPTSQYTSPSY